MVREGKGRYPFQSPPLEAFGPLLLGGGVAYKSEEMAPLWFTKVYLVSAKFYNILLSFTLSGLKSYQIPSTLRYR